MMGSVTSGPWAARNAVELKDGLLRSEGAGCPLNMSGATVRYPARAKESARLRILSIISMIGRCLPGGMLSLQAVLGEVDAENISQVQDSRAGHRCGRGWLADVEVDYKLASASRNSNAENHEKHLLPLMTCSVPTESPDSATIEVSPPMAHCCAPTPRANAEMAAILESVDSILKIREKNGELTLNEPRMTISVPCPTER